MTNLEIITLGFLVPAFVTGLGTGALLLWIGFRSRNTSSTSDAICHGKVPGDGTPPAEALMLAGVGWWELDPKTGKMAWSDSLFRLLAYPPRFFSPTRERCLALFAPEDLPRVQEACHRLERDGTPFDLYCRLMLADGRCRQFRLAALAGDDPNGRRILRGILQDVTDLSRAQEALSRTVERYRSILDGIDEAYVELDRRGKVVFFNRAFKIMTQFSSPRLLDADYRDLITPESLASARGAVRAALLYRRTATFECALKSRDGVIIPVEITLTLIQDAGKTIRGFRCLARNIAARLEAEAREREMEQRVWHAHKMESLAMIAGGVAHDFNNLLAAVLGYAELLRDEEYPDRKDQFLEEITRQVRRGAGLTDQLIACSGTPLCQPRQASLAHIVEAGARDISGGDVPDSRVRITTHPGMPPTWCDPDLARQAVHNLVTNALEATADTGKPVEVRVRVETVAKPVTLSCPPGMTLRPGTYHVVEVIDAGPGMMEETLLHVFDPFFSTRFTGRGLGLPATLGIMRAHDGMVEIISEPGRGTTARLWFPADRKTNPADATRPAAISSNN